MISFEEYREVYSQVDECTKIEIKKLSKFDLDFFAFIEVPGKGMNK